MNTRTRLIDIDRIGEALKDIGEGQIVVGFFPKSRLFEKDSYTVRFPLEGTAGVFASADTLSGALVKALAERAEKQREIAEEAEIRAEIESRRKKVA